LLRGCHVVMVAEVVGAAKTEVDGDGSTFEVVPPRSRKTSETWGTRHPAVAHTNRRPGYWRRRL
jgi:hypothetical protein